jgi:hypothetical protein
VSRTDRIAVRLVLHPSNRGWILEKFADRLVQHLDKWNVDAAIADEPSSSADLHHFMMYLHGPDRRIGPSTALVTHVDKPQKMYEMGNLLERIDAAVCLSRMSVEQLVSFGLPARKLCYIVPGCDPAPHPRRTAIVIASRLYRDLRKREDFLLRLAHSMRLDNFRFDILGFGWEAIANELRAAGAEVRHYPPTEDYRVDYEHVLECLSAADYYFYPGLDEGSMGLMDALAAGVSTISTPQGFHLDIPSGLTHAFMDFAEMSAIFQQLARERQDRIDTIAAFSWEEYARRHSILWRGVLESGNTDFGTLLDPTAAPAESRKPPSRAQRAGLWTHLITDEAKRIGKYLWKSMRGQTQPSESRRQQR